MIPVTPRYTSTLSSVTPLFVTPLAGSARRHASLRESDSPRRLRHPSSICITPLPPMHRCCALVCALTVPPTPPFQSQSLTANRHLFPRHPSVCTSPPVFLKHSSSSPTLNEPSRSLPPPPTSIYDPEAPFLCLWLPSFRETTALPSPSLSPRGDHQLHRHGTSFTPPSPPMFHHRFPSRSQLTPIQPSHLYLSYPHLLPLTWQSTARDSAHTIQS